MTTPLRIGIIGAGNVAARHADVLSGFPDVRLAAVADTDLAKARTLAGRYGARAYTGHADLLESEALDAVYVCLPPFAHGAPELDTISLDLPIFVEKPLALDLETAEKISAELARRGLVSAVGHHWRYLSVLEQARDLLADRPVRLAVGHWLDKVPPVPWWTCRDKSGGQVIEQAVHVLDLARVLVGEVTEVCAVPSAAAAGEDGDVDRATAAVLRFRGGAAGLLAVACLPTWKHRVGLEVHAAGLAVRLTETELTVWDGGGRRVTADDAQAKTRVDRAFVDAVREGTAVRADYAEALRTHRLACAVARSAAEGRSVIADG